MKKTDNETKVVTTVHLPISLYKRLVDHKERFGIPHVRTVQRGIELAINEFESMAGKPKEMTEADLQEFADMFGKVR